MLKKLLRYLTDLIFPPRCAVCGDVTPIGTEICSDCFDPLSVELDNYQLCSRCGKPLQSCVCRNLASFVKCISVFEYCDKTRRLFEKLKTDRDSSAAAQLAEMMAKRFYKSDLNGITFDFITSVPQSADKTAAKHFDHARRLAEQLSIRLDIPYVKAPIEQNSGYTAQHSLSSGERIRNAYAGYTLSCGKGISGRVLLVDDIITTGATLDRCAELLLLSGAEQVFCITAATTLLHKSSNKDMQ